jgi:hypothetical protein
MVHRASIRGITSNVAFAGGPYALMTAFVALVNFSNSVKAQFEVVKGDSSVVPNIYDILDHDCRATEHKWQTPMKPFYPLSHHFQSSHKTHEPQRD